MFCVLLYSISAASTDSTGFHTFHTCNKLYMGPAKLVLLHRPVSMSLRGEQSSLDEFRTVLKWQNGYSKFYTNTNKLCMTAPKHSQNTLSQSSFLHIDAAKLF